MWTAVSSSTGMLKKPWIWPWWRSIVSIRSAPATVIMSAIEPGRDRDARLVLLVGAAVGVVRDDRRDPPRRRPLEGVDHDQQLHDRLVHGAGRGLDEEHVLLADVVQDPHEDVLVRELEDLGLTAARVPSQWAILRASSGLALPW